MHVWIIGAGGLFGSSLVKVGGRLGHTIVTSTDVPWNDSSLALAHLSSDAERFLSHVQREGQSWAIVWAAGSVTTASSEIEAQRELDLYRAFVQQLKVLIDSYSPPPAGNAGVFCPISSAGAMYAGSAHPPFEASSPAVPVGTYGHLKQDQERIASGELSEECGVLLARVANLYGPGQNLTKLQGLISRLALATITREPISMFVPLDTLRDFIYVDDAAAALFHWLDQPQARTTTIRVIASGNPVSLGYLISLMQDITHTRIPVAYGMHPSAHAQARDIRLSPDSDPYLEGTSRTHLPEGMKDVFLDILKRHQLHSRIGN